MQKLQLFMLLVVMIFSLSACNKTAEVSKEPYDSELVSSEVSESAETTSEADAEKEDSATSEDKLNVQDMSDVNATSESDGALQESQSEENLSEDESVSEEESIAGEPEYTVQEHSAVLFVKKAVNVRKGPSTDYEKIGGLGKGEQIQVTGIADTGWYRIQYNDAEAYVAGSYLVDESTYQAMIAEEEAAALAAQQAAEQVAAEQQAALEQAAQQQVQAAQQQVQADYRAQVVAIMNQERANAGVGGINQNSALDAVAQIRAQEIVQSFAHTRPDGSDCFTVLGQNGIAYVTAGENIAAGYGTPEEVMNGWMSSEGHRANILNGSFGQVGIGYYSDPNTSYRTYWVQVFTN